MDFRVHHEVQNSDDVVSKFTPVDYVVDHAVFEEKLRPLKVLWQFLSDGLLDYSWSGKPDERFWFGNNYIAQHREACRHAASRRVS